MRGYSWSIVAVAAVAAAGAIAIQTGVFDRTPAEAPEAQAAEPPAVEATPVAEPAPTEAPSNAQAEAEAEAEAAARQIAELQAGIAELSGRIDAREAALAELKTALAERDASLAEAAAALAARDAELAELRAELDAMRERYAFDVQLAAMKIDAPAEAAPAPAAAVADADMLLAAAKGPGPREEPMTDIQFETGSSALSPGAQIHAAAAAVMLGDMTLGRVRLVGHTDRVGSAARNRVLAEARARAVADFLVASGVSASLIETAAMGETELPIATGDGVAEPLNRSVAIIAVPLPTT